MLSASPKCMHISGTSLAGRVDMRDVTLRYDWIDQIYEGVVFQRLDLMYE